MRTRSLGCSVPDRVSPRVADGAPIEGDLVAVVDESSPHNEAGGVAYVVAIAAIFDPTQATLALDGLFPADRQRPFHWEREGRVARTRIIEIADEVGVSAAAFYSHVSRKGQVRARSGMLTRVASHVASQGVDYLIIEASDVATVRRDRHTLLETFHAAGGVPFTYDWRSKAERLLWIAGADGEYVIGKDPTWYDLLAERGILTLMSHP